MKTISAGLAAAFLLSGGAAQADPSQLIAHLGLTPDQAATLTRSEIAAMKFNRDSGADNQQSLRSAPPVTTTRAFLPTWQDDGH
jgi:hypothetical protein